MRFNRGAFAGMALGGLLVAGAAAAEPPASSVADAPLFGVVSELRLGLLAHDVGLLGVREEEGYDANLELLFASPRFLAPLLSPRPHLGVSVNSEGETSQVYAGLTWEWELSRPLFLELSFGGSLHDGETDGIRDPDGKSLGCSLLFRGAASLVWRLGRHHSLSLMFDHISNGGLCNENQGLDTFGIRYGYRF